MLREWVGVFFNVYKNVSEFCLALLYLTVREKYGLREKNTHLKNYQKYVSRCIQDILEQKLKSPT